MANGLSEEEHKELLLNELGDDEYQRLLSRLLPKKLHKLPFCDLIVYLRKQFHDDKTLFQHFEALNFQASLPMTVVEILDNINVLGDNFEFVNFKIDQFKILLTALALIDHFFHSERTILFKLISEKESCTFSDIREICHAHAECTADVMRVEDSRSSEVNTLKQFDKKNKGKSSKRFSNDRVSQKVKKSDHTFAFCRGCGALNHKRIDSSFKRNVTFAINLDILLKFVYPKLKLVLSCARYKVFSTRHQHCKFANISNNKVLKMQLDTGVIRM